MPPPLLSVTLPGLVLLLLLLGAGTLPAVQCQGWLSRSIPRASHYGYEDELPRHGTYPYGNYAVFDFLDWPSVDRYIDKAQVDRSRLMATFSAYMGERIRREYSYYQPADVATYQRRHTVHWEGFIRWLGAIPPTMQLDSSALPLVHLGDDEIDEGMCKPHSNVLEEIGYRTHLWTGEGWPVKPFLDSFYEGYRDRVLKENRQPADTEVWYKVHRPLDLNMCLKLERTFELQTLIPWVLELWKAEEDRRKEEERRREEEERIRAQKRQERIEALKAPIKAPIKGLKAAGKGLGQIKDSWKDAWDDVREELDEEEIAKCCKGTLAVGGLIGAGLATWYGLPPLWKALFGEGANGTEGTVPPAGIAEKPKLPPQDKGELPRPQDKGKEPEMKAEEDSSPDAGSGLTTLLLIVGGLLILLAIIIAACYFTKSGRSASDGNQDESQHGSQGHLPPPSSDAGSYTQAHISPAAVGGAGYAGEAYDGAYTSPTPTFDGASPSGPSPFAQWPSTGDGQTHSQSNLYSGYGIDDRNPRAPSGWQDRRHST